MTKRHSTRREDAAFIIGRVADAARGWKVGDVVWSFKGERRTTVDRIEGDIIYLADGTSGHRTRMKTWKGTKARQAAKEIT